VTQIQSKIKSYTFKDQCPDSPNQFMLLPIIGYTNPTVWRRLLKEVAKPRVENIMKDIT